MRTYASLDAAYKHFNINTMLFGGLLSPCLITMPRHKGAYGYFVAARMAAVSMSGPAPSAASKRTSTTCFPHAGTAKQKDRPRVPSASRIKGCPMATPTDLHDSPRPSRRCLLKPPIRPRADDVKGREEDRSELKRRLGLDPRRVREPPSHWVYPDAGRIRQLRKERGWNKPELARYVAKVLKIDLNRPGSAEKETLPHLLGRLEREESRNRTSKDPGGLLHAVAQVFGLPIEDLIDRHYSATSVRDRPLVVMKGLPGVGKSTLASLLCNDPEVMAAFPDAFLWVTLGPDPDLKAGLNEWCKAVAEALGEHHAPPATLDAAKRYLVDALEPWRGLLIVNDAWETDHAHWFDVAGQSCATLITTRLARDLTLDSSQEVFHLRLLDDDTAFELFRRLAAPWFKAEYEASCKDLVHALEGLPLAIHVAAKLLGAKHRVGVRVEALIEDILKKGQEIKHLLDERVPEAVRVLMPELGPDMAPTVSALLDVSTSRLSDSARVKFAYLGKQAPKPATFSGDEMMKLWRVKTFDAAEPILQELLDFGLLERVEEDDAAVRGPEEARYYMHALLVAKARSLARK